MSMTVHQKSMLSEINITPFVDVMLVLLVIFMVTTPMMQQGIDVQLPETASSGVATREDPFVLIIQRDGQIKVDSVHIPIESLRQKLTAIFEVRQNKQIYIQADKMAYYGVVAEVMGEVNAAGISDIGLITLPKAD